MRKIMPTSRYLPCLAMKLFSPTLAMEIFSYGLSLFGSPAACKKMNINKNLILSSGPKTKQKPSNKLEEEKNAWSQVVHFSTPFSAPLMQEVLLCWKNMRRMACAVTFGGRDTGNSAQELKLEPGRRPKQSSLNITYL